jgi:hypothetical protein
MTETHTTTDSYTLVRGCALFADRKHRSPEPRYFLGTIDRVAAVTSAFERTALMQLSEGRNPLAQVDTRVREELIDFLSSLTRMGLLNHSRRELYPAKRFLEKIPARDMAIKHLRERSAPELAQSEWIDSYRDGGTTSVAGRSQFPIELSGRSRVISLLYSILLGSGVTRVRFADRYESPSVTSLDIGFGAITDSDLGLNYYQLMEERRRALSLFPIESDARFDNDHASPLLTVHYGTADPEQIIEWAQARRPYFLIHEPIGDEVAIGPLVIPGESPCLRCLSLYEIDNWGFTRLEKIALTTVGDLPTAAAYYVAAIAASQILHFIDGSTADCRNDVARNMSIGEVTYINFQRLTEPQVVAIARHPLCGCDR